MDIHITKTNKVIAGGKLKGNFKKLQKKIEKKNPELISKHKSKAVYLGDGEIRYIADWDAIMEEFFTNEFLRESNKHKEP